MQKISSKQAISILTLFCLGSSMTIGLGTDAKQDTWIAILIGLFLSLPMICTFARILSLYPGKNLYDIIIDLFGKVIGKIIIFLYFLYLISVGALILRNFADFIDVEAMPETPKIVIMIFMLIFSLWMVKSGIEPFGRVSKFILPILVIAMILMLLVTLKFMKVKYMKPIMGTDFSVLMNSSLIYFSLPFSETVIFAFLFSSVKENCNPYKVYGIGVGIAAVILLQVTLRDILVLGVPALTSLNYPSYQAIGIVAIGDFFTRIEVLIGMIYILAGFAKVSVVLYAASLGMAKIINIQQLKNLATPVGLLMLTLGLIFYTNSMDVVIWLRDIFKFYALPFQVVIPLIVLAGAEIKTRIKRLIASDNTNA